MKGNNLALNFGKYVSLNILGMLGLSCYILADTFFVSKGLGMNGLAALNLAIPAYSFIHGLGLMIGMGGGIRYSMKKAASDGKPEHTVFTQCTLFALAIAAVFVLLGLFAHEKIALMLGANQEIIGMASIYLRVIFLFSPAFLMNNVLIFFVRNDGNPALSMIAMLTGSFSNIILDYVFIFPFKMGMLGAVVATGLAPVISIAVLAVHFFRKKNKFYFKPAGFRKNAISDIVSLGNSALITEFASGIVMIIFNRIILKLSGNTGVAAYGIIANISLVATSIFSGIAQGIQPLISVNSGLGNKKNIKTLYRYGITLSTAAAVIIYLILITFSSSVIAIFNSENNQKLADIAQMGIYYYFTAFVFAGFNIITAIKLGATEKTKQAFVISISRGFLFIIPIIFILSSAFGIKGVWISFPVTELLTMCLALLLIKRSNRT